MIKKLFLSLILVGCGSLFNLPKTNYEHPLPPKSVVGDAVNDTVALVDEFALESTYCSGVISHSLIITAAHCVDDGDVNLFVAYKGKNNKPVNPLRVERIYYDPEQDLAILRPKEVQLPHGRSLSPEGPRDGQVVVAVGHPLGLTWTITTGIVARESRIGGVTPTQHWFQVTSQITFGNSGGPVYNRHGEVLGIASFRGPEAYIGGAIHWAQIKKALDKVKPQGD